ncbi:MAG: hypothetical protein SOZ89_04790 [Peptoniphilaceae bacterium]|nr:hypothetical protein [Peptoniphilaceae bacterium]MDY3738423.1 hypothetical protein [Peptoniphilaceae bacterium]
MSKISSILRLISSIAVGGFGVYFREYFEIVLCILGVIASIAKFNQKFDLISLRVIKNKENSKFFILMSLIVIYSLINPIGLIAVIYDIYKRDFFIKVIEKDEKVD